MSSQSSASLTSSDKKAFNFTGKKASVSLNTDELKIEYSNPSEKYKILEYLVVNSNQKQNQQLFQPLQNNQQQIQSLKQQQQQKQYFQSPDQVHEISPFTVKSNLPLSALGGPSPTITIDPSLQTQLLSTRLTTQPPMKLSDLLSKTNLLSNSAQSKLNTILNANNINSSSKNNNNNQPANNQNQQITLQPGTQSISQQIRLPTCKTHKEQKVFFYKKDSKMLCCRSLTLLKEKIQVSEVVMSDEYSREKYKQWQDLTVKAHELTTQIDPRAQINGFLWSQILDRVLQNGLLSGHYDQKFGQIHQQWFQKVKSTFELVESFTKNGRADKIQELDREFKEFQFESDRIQALIRHSDLFKEDLLINIVAKLINIQINEAIGSVNPIKGNGINLNMGDNLLTEDQSTLFRQSTINFDRKKSFGETQEATLLGDSRPKQVEDIIRQFYENRQRSIKKPPSNIDANQPQKIQGQSVQQNNLVNPNISTLTTSRTISNNRGGTTAANTSGKHKKSHTTLLSNQYLVNQSTLSAAKPLSFGLNSFRNQMDLYTQNAKDAKQIIYEVQDVSRDISENEMMLRVCQEVALRDEEIGQNLDAYDLLDRASQAQEQMKQLKQKKNKLLRTLKDRKRSMDALKRQMTPAGTRPLSHLRKAL